MTSSVISYLTHFSNLKISGTNADICKRSTAFSFFYRILCDARKKSRGKNSMNVALNETFGFVQELIRVKRENNKTSLLRPRPRVTRYFCFRNFFFLDSKISPSTRSVFKSNSPLHMHPMVPGYTVVSRAPLH